MARPFRPLFLASLCVALVGGVVAVPAVAQSGVLPDSAFDARTNAELHQLIEAARASGIPTAPLVSRALQGAARRVSGARVVALVKAHADSMRAARYALGNLSSADELDAGATALRAGASRLALRRVRTTRAPGEATTALVVLTDLLSRGIKMSDASDALADLAEHAPDSTLLSLQAAVAREGSMATPERLRALVNEAVRTLPPVPPGKVPIPPHRRPTTDETSESSESSETPNDFEIPSRESPRGDAVARAAPSALTGASFADVSSSLGVASTAARTRGNVAQPNAMVVDGRYHLPSIAHFDIAPGGTMAMADGATRWAGALTVARPFRLNPSLSARLFAAGEVHTGIATSRNALALDPRLDAQVAPKGRKADASFRVGSEWQRRIGATWFTGSVAFGEEWYSRLAQATVEVFSTPADSTSPRPDTLAPVRHLEQRSVWRAISTTSFRSGMALQHGGWLVRGAYAQRLDALPARNDSTAPTPRSLITVGVERRIAPWAVAQAQWTSRDPARVLGAPSLNEARLTFGLRFTEAIRTPRRPATVRHADEGALVIAVRVTSMVQRESEALGAGPRARVVVTAPRASSVEVEGDVTDWNPRPLSPRHDGTFTGEFAAPSGIVRLRVRANGGRWFAPDGAPIQRDEFGEEVAVFVLAPDGAASR